jgi:GNAT superfamily N-acetyltransferase
MPIIYRPARADDLEASDRLTVASINDLTERHAFGPMAAPSPQRFQMFSLQDDPDGLWVAEDAGQLLGFAFSWACGDLWFLAQLFIAPGNQGQGIGNALIARTLEHAQKAGAASKALITFTFNRVSQALYIRHGLFPWFPVYGLNAARGALRLPGERLASVPLEASPAHLRSLDRIDAVALGVSREKHHRYLLPDGANKGVLLLSSGGEHVGYAYIAGGHVGPLAVAIPEAVGPALITALALAAESGTAEVSAFIPGVCHAALGLAVASGMRITFPMLLMADHEFGDWKRYLPRNPGFM